MVKKIVGGVVALVIGGTTYAVSTSDITDNFSKNTGMSKDQAQQYVNNMQESDLESFSKVGEDLISDGKLVGSELATIDCVNYQYDWESPTLSCTDGVNQLQTIGNDEITLGNCYKSLETNLGNAASSKMNECIHEIDTLNADYDFPIASAVLDSKTISDTKNTNIYNKSVLQSALQSK